MLAAPYPDAMNTLAAARTMDRRFAADAGVRFSAVLGAGLDTLVNASRSRKCNLRRAQIDCL